MRTTRMTARCVRGYVCGPAIGLPRPVFLRCARPPHADGKHQLRILPPGLQPALTAIGFGQGLPEPCTVLLFDPVADWLTPAAEARYAERLSALAHDVVVGGGRGRPIGIQVPRNGGMTIVYGGSQPPLGGGGAPVWGGTQ